MFLQWTKNRSSLVVSKVVSFQQLWSNFSLREKLFPGGFLRNTFSNRLERSKSLFRLRSLTSLKQELMCVLRTVEGFHVTWSGSRSASILRLLWARTSPFWSHKCFQLPQPAQAPFFLLRRCVGCGCWTAARCLSVCRNSMFWGIPTWAGGLQISELLSSFHFVLRMCCVPGEKRLQALQGPDQLQLWYWLHLYYLRRLPCRLFI